jgi:type I restriction enzyme S subunit
VSFFHNDKPYLSIVKDGSGFGRITKMEPFSSVIGTLQYIYPKDGINLDYLYYSLLSIDFKKYVAGAAIPHIYFRDYQHEPFLLLPLPEQERIVAILDKAFEGIDQAIANTEQNLASARELFESYLNTIFTQRGDGWVEKKLGDVCEKIQDGAHHSPKKLYDTKGIGQHLYITSKNIRNNYIDMSKIQYVDADFHNSIYQRCNPALGDVLLTKDGANTGNVTLNTIDEQFSLLSSVCLFKTNKKHLIPSFLKYYIQSPEGFKQITGKMTGTAIKRIVLKTIKAATIPLPSLDEQIQLVVSMNLMLQQTQQLEALYKQKLNSLKELKQSLLQKAFAGELTKEAVA